MNTREFIKSTLAVSSAFVLPKTGFGQTKEQAVTRSHIGCYWEMLKSRKLEVSAIGGAALALNVHSAIRKCSMYAEGPVYEAAIEAARSEGFIVDERSLDWCALQKKEERIIINRRSGELQSLRRKQMLFQHDKFSLFSWGGLSKPAIPQNYILDESRLLSVGGSSALEPCLQAIVDVCTYDIPFEQKYIDNCKQVVLGKITHWSSAAIVSHYAMMCPSMIGFIHGEPLS